MLGWRDDFYEKRHPEPKDVILLIEISDSCRIFDLGTKQDLYASHGIPEYWVIDKQLEGIQVFRDPFDGVYREKRIYRCGEAVPLPKLPEGGILVSNFFA